MQLAGYPLMAMDDGKYDQIIAYLISRARMRNEIEALVRESEVALNSPTSTETRKEIAREVLRALARP
jgi:hypothetical protein